MTGKPECAPRRLVSRLLTDPQRAVLHAFARMEGSGPTFRELCDEFGWRSTGTARGVVYALERAGFVEAVLPPRHARRWQVTARGLKLARDAKA